MSVNGMNTSATNRKLRLLLTGIRDGTVIPRPEFQRRLVWTNKHKIEFIRTVLMGFPFPEIYVAAGDVNPDTGEGAEMLVDGQQRITTLDQYFRGSGDLRLGDIRAYKDLTNTEKKAFLEYEVVIRDLGPRTIEEIREVFKRINSTKYSLNAMEIHNARYDGAFKQFAENLSQSWFFDNHRVFKTNDIRRMGDMVFCLTLAITIMSKYFNRDDEIEDYLARYNDEFPQQSEIEEQIEEVFAKVDAMDLPDKSRAWRKADLLTLLVEVHRVLYRDEKPINPVDVRSSVQNLYKRVDEIGRGGTDIDEINAYYRASIQATNDRSSRVRRGEIVYRIMSGDLELEPLSKGK